jgi:hypothetical protein
VCIPGHECCSHFVRSVRNAGKDTRSPVPGTIVLSLSGRPLGSSREIAKASGPADVSRLGLRISAEAEVLRHAKDQGNRAVPTPIGFKRANYLTLKNMFV